MLKSWKNGFIIVIFGTQNQLCGFPLFLMGKIGSVLKLFSVQTQVWNDLKLTTEVISVHDHHDHLHDLTHAHASTSV